MRLGTLSRGVPHGHAILHTKTVIQTATQTAKNCEKMWLRLNATNMRDSFQRFFCVGALELTWGLIACELRRKFFNNKPMLTQKLVRARFGLLISSRYMRNSSCARYEIYSEYQKISLIQKFRRPNWKTEYMHVALDCGLSYAFPQILGWTQTVCRCR